MGQFVVIVEPVMFVAEPKRTVPFHAGLAPMVEPFELLARAHEKLHLHLFELAHAENELPGNDLVAESLADLRDTERNLHTAGFLDIEEIHENPLRRFGPQVDRAGPFGHRTHFGFEHQVELAHFGPIARTGNRADDFGIEDDLAQFLKVVVVQSCDHPFMDSIALGPVLDHARIRLAEKFFVETFSETFARFLHLFLDLLILFGEEILEQHIGTVTFLRVAVVDQRIVECAHMARSLPGFGVHEDGRIDAYDVLVEFGHRIPPIFFDVIFQFDAHLPVIVNGAQPVVNFTRREDKPVLLAVGDQFLEKFILCHMLYY